MAESSLSLTYTDIAVDVSDYLGYGIDNTAWDTRQTHDITRAIDKGFRDFFGAKDPRTGKLHRWNFTNSSTTITTAADDYQYDLPDNFGSIDGSIYYPLAEGEQPIYTTGYQHISQMRAEADIDGYPRYAAINAKASDGTSGQRFELVFYPTPDRVWSLIVHYNILVEFALTSTYLYPLGGMAVCEAVKYACISAAEVQKEGSRGPANQEFLDTLVSAIDWDRRNSPSHIGSLENACFYGNSSNRYYGSAYYATIDGVRPS